MVIVIGIFCDWQYESSCKVDCFDGKNRRLFSVNTIVFLDIYESMNAVLIDC